MTTFFIVFTLLGTVIALMAVGVIFQNKPIKGSCGGMASLGMETDCDICGGKPEMCEKTNKESEKTSALRKHLKADERSESSTKDKDGDIRADHTMTAAMSTPRDSQGKSLKLPDSDVEGHLFYDASKNKI